MNIQELVEKNRDLVNQYYPGLSNSNTYEWNHKIAYMSWLESGGYVGQKSTSPTSPVSEDTIGILTHPLTGELGQNFYPFTFEAVDLRNGSTGEMQWLSFGMVSQNFIIPTVADISQIPDNGNPVPTPRPFPSYEELGGDELCRELIGTPLAADYTEAHAINPAQPLIDDGVSVWTNRTVYDAIRWVVVDGKLPRVAYELSAKKRRPEWRAALGLPPL